MKLHSGMRLRLFLACTTGWTAKRLALEISEYGRSVTSPSLSAWLNHGVPEDRFDDVCKATGLERSWLEYGDGEHPEAIDFDSVKVNLLLTELSKEELADMFGVDRRQITKWQASNKIPKAKQHIYQALVESNRLSTNRIDRNQYVAEQPPTYAVTSKHKVLEMNDEHMQPKIPIGFELTVDTTDKALVHNRYYAIKAGDGYLIRRAVSSIHGIILCAVDRDIPEITDTSDVTVIGRVIRMAGDL